MKRLRIRVYDSFKASDMVDLAHAVQRVNESTPILTEETGFVLLIDELEQELMEESLQSLVEDMTICDVKVASEPNEILF